MKNYQSDKLKMYAAVKVALKKNQDAWSGIPYLSSTISLLYSNIDAIMLAAQQQITDITGYGIDKKQKRSELEKSMYLCALLIKAYAVATGNDSLLGVVKLTKSSLRLSRDKILSFDAKELLELISLHEAALAGYGITPAVKSDFEQKINAFNTILNSPLAERKSTKEATIKIAKLIRETDDLLISRLDGQMRVFEESQSIFYLNYKQNRKIVHSPTIKLAMRIKVTDSQTKQPLQGALIKIKNHKINRKTSPQGQILIRNLKEGKHQIDVSAEGYLPITAEATRIKGETVNVEIEMEKGE